MTEKRLITLALFLVAAGAALRLARHFGLIDLPPNVAPVSALAMFSAVYLPRRWSLAVPLGLMLISDAVIGWYQPAIMASVYGGFVISYLLGRGLRTKMKFPRLILASLAGSIAFFLVTNAAVWAFGTLYPRDLSGLGASYLAGLPFFRNTVIGDLGYAGLFFGLYAAVVLYSKRVERVVTTS